MVTLSPQTNLIIWKMGLQEQGGGSDSSIFQVIYASTPDGEGGYTATCNHTITEIAAAYNVGKYIAVEIDGTQALANFYFEDNYAYIQVNSITAETGNDPEHGTTLVVRMTNIAHEFSDNEETIIYTYEAGATRPFNPVS